MLSAAFLVQQVRPPNNPTAFIIAQLTPHFSHPIVVPLAAQFPLGHSESRTSRTLSSRSQWPNNLARHSAAVGVDKQWNCTQYRECTRFPSSGWLVNSPALCSDAHWNSNWVSARKMDFLSRLLRKSPAKEMLASLKDQDPAQVDSLGVLRWCLQVFCAVFIEYNPS